MFLTHPSPVRVPVPVATSVTPPCFESEREGA